MVARKSKDGWMYGTREGGGKILQMEYLLSLGQLESNTECEAERQVYP